MNLAREREGCGMTTREAAQQLGISYSGLMAAIYDGRVQERAGRFGRSMVWSVKEVEQARKVLQATGRGRRKESVA
jgi:hypothetical protein